MNPLTHIQASTVIFAQSNIDTDQIIPARFLTTTERTGLGRYAFNDWRYLADGAPNPEFPLHQPANQQAQIIVAGRNFGCGSSREHAPWALLDLGIRAVISSEIADIFRSNALKNGLLPIVLAEADVQSLMHNPGEVLQIDVAGAEVTRADGSKLTFPIDAFAQTCLLQGVDQLGYLLNQEAAIQRFEAARRRTV